MSGCNESLFGLFGRLLPQRSKRTNKPRGAQNRAVSKDAIGCEALELRQMLTGSTDVPSIQGTIFVDVNDNGVFDAGEGVDGATVQLFLDDGDGLFETNGDDVQVGVD